MDFPIALCRPLALDPALANRCLLAALSLPHILYAAIWLKPGWWRATFQKSSVEVFAVVAGFGKLLQAEAVLVWLWSQRPQGLCLDLSRTHLWQWLAALLLFSFGQALNVGIYKAIGKVGVYYGTRLGHTVPWVTGFPFSVVPHPQYVGSALSVWGGAALLANQLPPDCCGGLANAQVLGLAAFWSLLYAMSAVIESYL
ncbi:hypothetical protein V8C86DRAFT_2722049 [Haematococcus lacustris]